MIAGPVPSGAQQAACRQPPEQPSLFARRHHSCLQVAQKPPEISNYPDLISDTTVRKPLTVA